jgi:hypothetical protein
MYYITIGVFKGEVGRLLLGEVLEGGQRYRGTSLIRNRRPLGPYRVLGGWVFSYE